MAGGDETTFLRAKLLFESMGKTIALFGVSGADQHCTMANQIAIAAGMIGWAEAVATPSAPAPTSCVCSSSPSAAQPRAGR